MVARQLADAGSAQRLLVRDAGRAPELEGAVPLVFSYADPVSPAPALEGVKTLFMVSAAEAEDRLQQHYTFIDAAAAAGVQHIVYTSFFGAAPDSVFTLGRDHYATEERIKASGMDYTFLRDNFYLDFLPLLAGRGRRDPRTRRRRRDGRRGPRGHCPLAPWRCCGTPPCMWDGPTTSPGRRTSRWPGRRKS